MLLVLRLTEFILGVKVDPQLEANRWFLKAVGHLSMHDTFASSHPLDIAGADPTTVSLKVLVAYFSFQHVSHCLKATMWMVREPSWQLDLKQVQHQERIQVRQVTITNYPRDSSTITFPLLLGLEHLFNGSNVVHLKI